MFNLWIIALFVVVMLRDSLGDLGSAAAMDSSGRLGEDWLCGEGLFGTLLDPGNIWVWVLGLMPYALIAVFQYMSAVAIGREMDHHGRVRSIIVYERTSLAVQGMVLLVHVGNVFALGWLSAARQLIGDVVLVDELMCLVPPMGVMAVSWCAGYLIERRVREAMQMRALDRGEPVYAIPTMRDWIKLQGRTQLGLSVLPICLIAGWHEVVDRVMTRLGNAGESGIALLERVGLWLGNEGNAVGVKLGLQLVGVACVFMVSPLILSMVWDTVRLSPGEMRERLTTLCREHRVRIREILVWRTYGSMSNGAVVGLLGRLRYVLLTDALIERMPRRQVEAVMAHEIGHARHAHMPYLALVMLIAVIYASLIGELGLYGLSVLLGDSGENAGQNTNLAAQAIAGFGELGVMLGSLIIAYVAFGMVSRRFEWQADAFAVKALSKFRNAKEEGQVSVVNDAKIDVVDVEGVIKIEAVEAMAGALETVARLNFVPRHRKSFRHGSIALRVKKLKAISGQMMDELRIDRTVRRIKCSSIVLFVGVIVLLVLGF